MWVFFLDCSNFEVVLPLNKRGDPNSISYYRAISLVCTISKVMDITSFTDHHKLTRKQHGVREQRCRETAISQCYKVIVSGRDKGNYVIERSINFSRAFDMVDPSMLLAKLEG